jgi:hypothetical protein
MRVEDYFSDLQLEVKSNSEALGDYEHVAFTNWALAKLADANEVIDLTESQYEGSGKNKKRLRIDAYGFDSLDDSLVCVVTDYSASPDLAVLTKTEVQTLFGQLRSFLETAIDDERVIDFEHSSEAAQAAIELRSKFRATSKIRFYLVTNKKLSDRIKGLPPGELDRKRIEYFVWDVERFFSNMAETTEAQEVEIDLTEWAPDGIPALRDNSANSPMTTYLMVVPGTILAAVYDRYGSRLLEGNVRSFLSLRGAVNKGIRSTILKDPEKFLAYNNGLSTTATEISAQELSGVSKITSIRGLQIVNGGQTTASLFAYMRQEKQRPENLSKVFVQMKLIVVPQEISLEMVPFIARYANTQNRISEADFFSNSPFHVRMEEISKRISSGPRPGEIVPTKWFYERARGSYLNEKNKFATKTEATKFEKTFPRSQVLTKTDLAKYHNSWTQKPNVVSKGAQKNFIEFANDVADRFANEETKAHFGDDFYKRSVCQAIIFQSTHKGVRASDWYESGFLANIVTYSIARLSFELNSLSLEPDWDHIWRMGEVSDEFTQVLVDVAERMTAVLNDDARTQKNVSEWAKLEKCWAQAKITPIELPAAWIESLRESTKESKRERFKEEKAKGQVLNEVEQLTRLYTVPHDTWDAIVSSNRIIISPIQHNIIKLFRGGAVPSPKQIERLFEVLDRAAEEGLISREVWG